MLFAEPSDEPSRNPRLPGEHPYFSFTMSPWDLAVDEQGRVMAQLCMATATPGLLGVVRVQGRVDHSPACDAHRRWGRIVVEHSIRVRAWDADREDYLHAYQSDDGGRAQYLDAWTRVEWQQGVPVYTVDAEGYRGFLRQLAEAMHPTQAQIDAAWARLTPEQAKDVRATMAAKKDAGKARKE